MKHTILGILAVSTLLTSAPASAQHRHYNYYARPAPVYTYPAYAPRVYVGPRPYYGNNWVVPAIVAGAAIAAYSTSVPQVVEQPTYVQPTYVQPTVSCSEWKEVRLPDGSVQVERVCSQR